MPGDPLLLINDVAFGLVDQSRVRRGLHLFTTSDRELSSVPRFQPGWGSDRNGLWTVRHHRNAKKNACPSWNDRLADHLTDVVSSSAASAIFCRTRPRLP